MGGGGGDRTRARQRQGLQTLLTGSECEVDGGGKPLQSITGWGGCVRGRPEGGARQPPMDEPARWSTRTNGHGQG